MGGITAGCLVLIGAIVSVRRWRSHRHKVSNKDLTEALFQSSESTSDLCSTQCPVFSGAGVAQEAPVQPSGSIHTASTFSLEPQLLQDFDEELDVYGSGDGPSAISRDR